MELINNNNWGPIYVVIVILGSMTQPVFNLRVIHRNPSEKSENNSSF